MNKINNKCRTCFNASKGLQSLTKMAIKENNHEKSYAELLNEVTNINIINDESPQLPQFICGCCSRKLKAAHAFVQQVQGVNEKLCSMVLQHDANKQLDCSQEIQFDKNSCLEIKIEPEELLDQNIQFKKEESEEDFLTTNTTKMDDLIEGNSLTDSFHMPLSNLTFLMLETEGNPQNSSQQYIDTSGNSNSDHNESFSSDNKDFREEQQIFNKTQKKKKSPLLTRSLLRKTSRQANAMDDTSSIQKKNKKPIEGDELLPAKCNDCDKVFPNSNLLNRHRQLTHVPDDLKVQCLFCEAKFSRRYNMHVHMRLIHKSENLQEYQIQPKKKATDKQYVCQECSRSYTHKYKLTAHINQHHDPNKEMVLQPKKRFLCTLCGLAFESQSMLKIHTRRHTGEKPFKCEFCDKAFHRLYDLQVHRRTHTGEKPYQCTICEKAFRNSNKLTIHMRTHTNERPYKCAECEKTFKQSKDLNIHKRTHTGERPYKCGICQSTFTQSNSLRLHEIKEKHKTQQELRN